MFDERGVVEPKKFDPDRRSHESMVFGYGLHWCIGAFLARAQITQTFKPLLKRGIRRAHVERLQLCCARLDCLRRSDPLRVAGAAGSLLPLL